MLPVIIIAGVAGGIALIAIVVVWSKKKS
jgi:hypothetical protein